MTSSEINKGQGPSDEKCKYYIKYLKGNKDKLSEQVDDVTNLLEHLSLEQGLKDSISSLSAMPFDALVTDLIYSLNQDRLDLMNEFISAITKQREKHLAYKWLLKMFKEEFKCKLYNAKGDVRDVLKCLSEEECSRLNSAEEGFEIDGLFKILDERLDKRKHLLYERLICAMLMLDLDRNLPVLIKEIKDPDPLIETLGLLNKSEEESAVKVVNIYCHLRKNLIAGQLRTYDKFLFKLGDLHPDVFENLVGKKPDAGYLQHHVKDTILNMSKKILAKPFQADKEIDKSISGDNYVSLCISESQVCPGPEFGEDNNSSQTEYESNMDESVEGEVGFMGDDSKFCDLLNKIQDGYRRVLIQGRCGVGKTTMIQNMAFNWAQGKSLKQFYFFFLIKIRSLGSESSLYELLTENSLYPYKIPENWLIDYQHRTFICIDGLDELNKFSFSMKNSANVTEINKRSSATDIIINLLRQNLMPKATVTATSRPFVGLDAMSPDINFEIKGLTHECVIEFITKNVQSSQQESVKKSLRESPTLLSLCAIPYYACKVIRHLEVHSDLDLVKVKTYSELHAFIILDHSKRQTADLAEQESFNKSLPALAEIAWYIFNQSEEDDDSIGTRFEIDDISLLETDGAGQAVNKGKEYGLVHTSREEDADETTEHLEFSHLSVQEMLGAIHFLKESNEDIDYFSEVVKKLTHGESLEMMRIFLFAAVFDQDSKHLKRLRKLILGKQKISKQCENILSNCFEDVLVMMSEDKRHLLKLCLLSYETKSRKLAKKVSTEIKDRCLSIKDIPMNAIDVKALVYVLKDANLHKIILENASLSDYSCELLLNGVKSHKEITTIKLTGNQIEQQKTLALISKALLKNKDLEAIDLSRNSIDDECFKGLIPGFQRKDGKAISLNIGYNKISAECISSCLAWPLCNISSLNIGYLSPSNGSDRLDCTSLAKLLLANSTLKHLFLPGNNISVEGAESLALAIEKNDSLQSLGIGNNKITDIGAIAIAMALKKTKLNSLDLHYNQISPVGAAEIMSSFESSCEIHTLDLSHNNLGVEGAKNVAIFLKTNTSLQTLRIGNNSIKYAGAECIAQALHTNTSLETLSISDNDIGDDGASSFAMALKHNIMLRALSLRKNNICDEGARSIGQALVERSLLRYLELSDNNVGDAGAESIGSGLGANGSLSCLILKRNPKIGNHGINSLGDGKAENVKVKIVLDFINPNISDVVKERFICINEGLVRDIDSDDFPEDSAECEYW